jgi:hypothetical protein
MKGRTNKLEHELEKVQDQITTLKQALDTRSDYGLGRGDPGFAGREVNRALLERFEEREEGLKQAISETNRSEYGFCESVAGRFTLTAWRCCQTPEYAFVARGVNRSNDELKVDFRAERRERKRWARERRWHWNHA